MFYNTLKLDDIVQHENEKFEKKILLENEESKLIAMALKKDGIIPEHISNTDSCAYVYEGEVVFHFEAEKFEVKKGEIIMFKKDDAHTIHANKDSKFLIIRI